MKKGILISLALLLVGCNRQADAPEEIKPEISTMFIKNGVENNYTEAAAITNRLDNMRVNELEAVRFILNDEQNETAMEYNLSDAASLTEFKQQLALIQIDREQDAVETLPNSQIFAFEVKIKDKAPIVFKGNDHGFCLTKNQCVLVSETMQLTEFFTKNAKEGKAVIPVDLDETSVYFKTWAENPPKELEDTYSDSLFAAESEANLYPNVLNTWYFTDDKWRQALKMAFYINDEFDDYHTITDWNKVVAGLAMQQVQNGYKRNNYESDLNTYYGPQGDSVSIEMEEDIQPFHKLQPDRFVTYSMIEQAGAVLFGSDFIMPDISEKTLAVYPMFTVTHSSKLKLCDIHTPYEVFYATMESGWIQSEQVEGNKRTYDLLIYTETMETPDDGKTSHSFSEVFFVYRNDFNEPYDTITGNEEHFKQVRIELEEVEEGIRINSFKYLNKLENLDETESATVSDILEEATDSDVNAEMSKEIEATNSDASTSSDASTDSDTSPELDSTASDTLEEGMK